MTEDAQKRSSRACDSCKVKRIKCDDILDENTRQKSCKGCREIKQYCSFDAPVRRRGPAVGYKRKCPPSSSTQVMRMSESSQTPPPRHLTSFSSDTVIPSNLPEAPITDSGRMTSPDGSLTSSRPTLSTRQAPLLGLPRPMVDELLTAYFTHVHNVWPLIYKPSFTPYNASPLLLWSMLAISACVSPPSSASGFSARKLYRMAESELHRSGTENRIDVVQALILLSLTQTGCGDKGAAFIYASRAVGMILNMGLNLAKKGELGGVDEQTRSRVCWNCYVLDKSLSEETGRSYLLPYKRCSTPFPSLDEVDELEVWPPVSTSSAPLPRCVRRLTPRRGHVISCFVWTCRLAMVVEDILDLDWATPPGSNDFDIQFRKSSTARRGDHGEEQEATRIGEQLDLWRQMLPFHLTPNDQLSPLPHVSIGLAWHATATIMLHSRCVIHVPSTLSLPPSYADRAARSHKICSDAARQTVQMLRDLDDFGLLEQISSDAIHILSLATLFDAFDMANADRQVAARAKEDFTQCCAWLRHFSSMWPAASAHKLFFEAVLQGGLKLADPEAGNEDRASPLRHTASLLSPSLTGGLQAVRRNLSVSGSLDPGLSGTMIDPPAAGTGGMLQIPHYFWNHLSAATTMNGSDHVNHDLTGQNVAWDDMFNFDDYTIEPSASDGTTWAMPASGSGHSDHANTLATPQLAPLWSVPIAIGSDSSVDGSTQRAERPDGLRADQAAISAALMNFMADMTKPSFQP